jgi:predicted short-subunit dehydrogenase-like oxidoreductase (DUF2520 family)
MNRPEDTVRMGEDGAVSSMPPSPTPTPSVAVVGPGRAGGSLAGSLLAAGVRVTAMATRDGSPHPVPDRLGLPTCTPAETLDRADVVVLAVPDDVVAQVVDQLAGVARSASGRPVVAHLSGALGLEPLELLDAAGLPVAAWHVLQAFPSPVTGVRPGVVHALTADTPATEAALVPLIEALGGRMVRVRGTDRARYHAAAVLAANGTATLMLAAARQLVACGLSEAEALASLDPLVDSAREAVVLRGIPDGLTGPWVRGDVGTVARHLEALADDEVTERLYRALAEVVAEATGPETGRSGEAPLGPKPGPRPG